MITVIVIFTISEETNANILKEKFIETSTLYQDVEWLLRKNYISDIENCVIIWILLISVIVLFLLFLLKEGSADSKIWNRIDKQTPTLSFVFAEMFFLFSIWNADKQTNHVIKIKNQQRKKVQIGG